MQEEDGDHSARDVSGAIDEKLEDAKSLYVAYFFAAWGDRMWEFAAIVFLLEIFPDTLLPASLFGLFESVCGIAAGPSIGKYIDFNDRLDVIRTSIIGQNVVICLASFLFAYAIATLEHSSFEWRCFVVVMIVVAGMVAKVASSMNKVSIHKDWCVVVSGGMSRAQTLINANMRRCDLTCSIVAPLFVGILSAAVRPAMTCVFIAVWACCSLFVETHLTRRVYDTVEALQSKSTVQSPVALDEPEDDTVTCVSKQLSALRQYYAHRAFPVSLPYCLLYISVLSLGGTMVSYLRTLGVADFWLAAGRALGALVAIGSTYAVPVMVKKMGLVKTGVVASWVQVACLTPLLFVFLVVRDFHDQRAVWFPTIVIGATAASRFGLWGFDLAQTQLMQELVEPEIAGTINGAQETLMNTCYLVSYTFTVVFPNPKDFLWPVVFSYTAIFVAAVLFSRYFNSHPEEAARTPPEDDDEDNKEGASLTTAVGKDDDEHSI